MNDQGEMTELRILGDGIEAEIGAAVALELHGRIFAPIHDHQGNLACLINAQNGQAVETYRYSAFGEETILDAQGQKVTHTQVGNPWRFSSKRIDSETGWVYFGRRYYDPETGRWTTPDPISFAGGSNLYAYLHHNPLNAYDAYGLMGEAYRDTVNVGCNSPYYSGESDCYSSIFPSGWDYSTSDNPISSNAWGNFLDGTQAFINGFARGMTNPIKTAFNNSGIGWFVNSINEIMAAKQPTLDPGGIPGALRWDVPGTFRGRDGTWELVIHPQKSIIYHFNFVK